MCGRFALDVHGETVFAHFDWIDRARSETFLERSEAMRPQRNIAPTNLALVIGQRPSQRATLLPMRWGMKRRESKRVVINARVETLHERPMFRRAYERGRCLVPASGYYEWFDAGEGKNAYYAQDAKGQLLLMAGLYAKDPEGVFGFVVVTQPSVGETKNYHDRMPLFVAAADRSRWLDDAEARDALRAQPPALAWKKRNPKEGK